MAAMQVVTVQDRMPAVGVPGPLPQRELLLHAIPV